MMFSYFVRGVDLVPKQDVGNAYGYLFRHNYITPPMVLYPFTGDANTVQKSAIPQMTTQRGVGVKIYPYGDALNQPKEDMYDLLSRRTHR